MIVYSGVHSTKKEPQPNFDQVEIFQVFCALARKPTQRLATDFLLEPHIFQLTA